MKERKKKGGKGRKYFYSHMDRKNAPYVQRAKCWGSFCETRIKGRKPNPITQTEKKSAKDREQKPLSPSGRNNGSQVYEISKRALRKQMCSKEPEKREIANSKPMGSVWCEKKVRMGRDKPIAMQAKRVGDWWQAHKPRGWVWTNWAREAQ